MLRYQKRLRGLALAYAALAGSVDAIGFLKSGGLFVSFMTGNSTRLAVGIARLSNVAIAASALIFLFVLGVVLNVIASETGTAAHRKLRAAAGVASIMLLAAVAEEFGATNLTIGCLCLAMGAANAIFRRDGDVTIGVTYMTGTLVRLGHRVADSLRGRGEGGWLAYLLLWLALVFGGIVGAIGYSYWPHRCLWAAASFAAGLTAVTYVFQRAE